MSENTTPSESAAQVETPVAGVETAEPAVETPTSSDDVWNTPLNFTATEPEVETEGKEPEAVATPVAPEADEVKTEETEDEETEKEVLEAPTDKPAPLSRRKLREAEDKVITPLRDPDSPIEAVWQGLHDLNPSRAEELASSIIEKSIENFPDAWLERLTGIEGVTADAIKQKFSGVEPTQVNEGLQDDVKYLTDLYGEDWKDPNNDTYLLDEDKRLARVVRTEAEKTNESEKDTEIAKLKEELNTLKPEIDGIKSQQQAEYELRVTQAKDTAVNEYQSAIEKRSLPPLFEQAGLKVSENDPSDVKEEKEYIQSQFKAQDGFMSPFEQFAVTKFSDRESLGKIVARVDKYLDEATKAEVKASQTKDANKVQELRKIADARKADAKAESDRLAVLHKKASQEFLQTIPSMKLLERISDLERRLSLRQEIVGTTAIAANTKAWADKLESDPWSNEVSIVDRAASLSR